MSWTAGPGLRLAALSLAALMAAAVPVLPERVRADPPSAEDVERSKDRVRDRAAEVGRTKAELAQADGELERLAAAAASAVERWHGERVKLERARKAHQLAEAKVAQAEGRVDQARATLARFAADAYRMQTGTNPWAAVVAGRDGPQGFMDRAALMEMLAKRRAGFVQRIEAARNVADVFRAQARRALDDQRAATDRADRAKRAAAAAVAEQQAAVDRIRSERERLLDRLGSARAKAAELERQRRIALQRAEDRRAKQQYSGGGGGGGGGSTVTGAGRGAKVVKAALKWLGTPYSWGGGNASGPSYGIAHGSNIHGFDCSGLALYAWAKVGVRLDHWTGTQWTSGPHIPLKRLKPGDLVFFAHNTSNPDTIHHVGIFIGDGRMVEAPYTGAHVRISSIWRNGLIGATRPSG